MAREFNYVYITTNLISGKQYVGSHATDNIEDNYIGSGRYFLKSVKKEGKKNFKREILEECKDREDALHKEAEYIEKFQTLAPNGYNLCPHGGIGFSGAEQSEDTKDKIGKWQKGKTYEELYGVEQANRMKENQRLAKLGTTTTRKGKGHKKQLIEIYGEEEGIKRYANFVEKQKTSHEGKIWSANQRKLMENKEPWNKGKTYQIGPYSQERKDNLKKPKNTKQKEKLKDPIFVKQILNFKKEGFTLSQITQKTGINYFLLKQIL